MNLALISFHFSEYSFHLAKALANQHTVLLILNESNAYKELNEKVLTENIKSLKIILLKDVSVFNIMFVRNVTKVVSEIYRFSPDIIHYQEAPRDYLVAALPFISKYPSVVTIHDHKPHTGQDSNVRKRIKLYRSIMRRRADGLIVHGNTILIETEKMYPGKVGSVFSIPHGPLGESIEGDEIDFEWDVGSLLFFGRIEEYKGLKYLLAAANELSEKNIKFKVVIAGSGSDLEQYKNKILGDPNIELLDKYIPNEDIPELFKRANLIVLPYTDATQSGIVAMALKFGRPIVATDVGSIAEVVRHEYNGLLVQARNSVELAEAIEKLILDQALSKIMAINSLAMSNNEISWPVISNQTISVYKNIINR